MYIPKALLNVHLVVCPRGTATEMEKQNKANNKKPTHIKIKIRAQMGIILCLLSDLLNVNIFSCQCPAFSDMFEEKRSLSLYGFYCHTKSS